MRSIEDTLLPLILQGDSFTYHCVASRHHATPHRVAPCRTHHHNVGPHDHAVHIILLHLACHDVHACCYPMCLCFHVIVAVPLCLSIPCCCPIRLSIPCCCPMCLSSTIYLVVPCILVALCTLLSHLLCCIIVLVALLSHALCCPNLLFMTHLVRALGSPNST